MAGSLSIPIGLFTPSTGGVYAPTYDQVATNDIFKHSVLAFDDTAIRELAYAAFPIPVEFPSSVSAVTFEIYWTSALTTGNSQFDLDYRLVGGNDTESLDQATVQEALTVSDAAPSVLHRKLTAIVTATASNFSGAAEKILELVLARDGVTETSGIAGAVLVHGLLMKWT